MTLLSIIDRMAAEIARGPDPEEYVPRKAYDRANERADKAERDLIEQRRLLAGAAERVSALEQAFTESIEVLVLDEPIGLSTRTADDLIRWHRETRQMRSFAALVRFRANVDALGEVRLPIKRAIGEMLFRGSVDRIRVELSERFGAIRDPFERVVVDLPPNSAAERIDLIRAAMREGATAEEARRTVDDQ